MRPPEPGPVRAREWPALLVLAGVFAAGWLLVGAGVNVPVNDDWVYAWSVEHLLATGRLHVLEFSAIYPISQILWGALFAVVPGFSFGVLRFSTVVLSIAGCWAVYLILRELGCRSSTSLLGAVALALNPAYFALSFSFMTDVPFVSACTMATYCYVRAVRRGEAAAAWAAGLYSILAFLVRPVAIVLPLALLPPAIWTTGWRAAIRRLAAPLVTTLAVMVALQISLPLLLGPLDWAAVRQGWIQYWFLVTMSEYARWNVELLFIAVFPFAPLFVAYASGWRRALQVAGVAVALAIGGRLALGGLTNPLPDWQTWSLQEISSRSMIGGALTPSRWSLAAVPFAKGLGLLPLAALIVISWQRWRKWSDWEGGDLVIVTLAVLHIGAMNALWLFQDRYYLVLGPVLAIIGARALDLDVRGKWIATALLAVWAGIAISGTRDMLAFNQACARVVSELEASGIPPWDIDGGYSSNGWRLYAHPENLPPGADRRYDVPFVTSKQPPRYLITNSSVPGADVVRVVPLDRATWQATRQIYVVRRR